MSGLRWRTLSGGQRRDQRLGETYHEAVMPRFPNTEPMKAPRAPTSSFGAMQEARGQSSQDVAAHPHLGRERRVRTLNRSTPPELMTVINARGALDQVGDVVHLVKPQRCGVGGSLSVDTVSLKSTAPTR